MAKPRQNSKPSATVHNQNQPRRQHSENAPAATLRQALKNAEAQVQRAKKIAN